MSCQHAIEGCLEQTTLKRQGMSWFLPQHELEIANIIMKLLPGSMPSRQLGQRELCDVLLYICTCTTICFELLICVLWNGVVNFSTEHACLSAIYSISHNDFGYQVTVFLSCSSQCTRVVLHDILC